MTPRPALSRDRIVEAAMRVADRGGLSGVSMRNVGRELGVEAMSLYHHIAGKEALLDALADGIFARIELPRPGSPWREAMVARAASAREVLSAHPWALGLIESRRSPCPALLRHHDAVLGALRRDGFSVRLAGHAFSVLDAYVYGFVLTEVNLPLSEDGGAEELAGEVAPLLADHPYLAEFFTERVVGHDYSYAEEFDEGLAVVLDGLAQRWEREREAGR